MLEITQTLTISTSHITGETAELLYDTKWDGCGCLSVFDKIDYGWWIYIAPWYNDYKENVPVDLDACIQLARNNNCEWLCLDCDAAETELLPTYEW